MKKMSNLVNCKFTCEAEMKENKAKCRKTELMVSFSYSNAKLKDTKDVGFIQWNIPAVETCPWRTKHCEADCYALKCERYTSCRNRRQMHYEVSKREDFVEIMTKQIEYELNRKKYQNKTIFFRIHESGDFYNYEYLVKWYQITKNFVGRNIIFEAYTKSLPLFDKLYREYGRENVNIKVLSSIWADTKPEMIKMTKKLDLKVYTAIEGEKMDEFLRKYSTFEKCDCENCGKCKKCYCDNIDLVVEVH